MDYVGVGEEEPIAFCGAGTLPDGVVLAHPAGRVEAWIRVGVVADSCESIPGQFQRCGQWTGR